MKLLARSPCVDRTANHQTGSDPTPCFLGSTDQWTRQLQYPRVIALSLGHPLTLWTWFYGEVGWDVDLRSDHKR